MARTPVVVDFLPLIRQAGSAEAFVGFLPLAENVKSYTIVARSLPLPEGRGAGDLLTNVQIGNKTQQVTCVPSGTSGKEVFEHLPPDRLVEDIVAKEERILAIMAEIRQVMAGGAE